jgi:hypothetical protein
MRSSLLDDAGGFGMVLLQGHDGLDMVDLPDQTFDLAEVLLLLLLEVLGDGREIPWDLAAFRIVGEEGAQVLGMDE